MTVALPHSQLNAAKAVDQFDPFSDIFQECLSSLRRVCGNEMVLPKSCKISTTDLEIWKLSGRVESVGHISQTEEIVATMVCARAIALPVHRHRRILQRLICKEAPKLKR